MKPLIALLLLLAAPAMAEEPLRPITGYVQALDGDTLLAADGETRIRLAAIDAPEMDGRDGWHARMALTSLVSGSKITCVPSARDRHGRLIADCEGPTGNLAELMLASGYAVVHRLYSRDPALDQLEYRACLERVGLWADHRGRCLHQNLDLIETD